MEFHAAMYERYMYAAGLSWFFPQSMSLRRVPTYSMTNQRYVFLTNQRYVFLLHFIALWVGLADLNHDSNQDLLLLFLNETNHQPCLTSGGATGGNGGGHVPPTFQRQKNGIVWKIRWAIVFCRGWGEVYFSCICRLHIPPTFQTLAPRLPVSD